MAGFKVEQQDGCSLHRISKVDWSEHYQLIGEFITEFEKITANLRFVYTCILQAKGLNVWQLGEFILHIDTVGPRHLSISLCAAMRLLCPKQKQLLAAVDAINKETSSLVEKRNEIAHGEWHVGPEVVIISDTPDLPEKMGIKRKVSKTGMRPEELPTASEFKSLTARARMLVENIKDIHSTFITLEHSEQRRPGDNPC